MSNSLCPLSHNTHTDATHTTHTERSAVHAENPDGDNNEPEAEILGEDSHGLEGKESPEAFDFNGFFELANRVLNGDSEAMASLNSLKDRWEQKFKTSKNPALKSSAGDRKPWMLVELAIGFGHFFSPRKGAPDSLCSQFSDIPTQLLEDFSQDSRQEVPSRNFHETVPLEASIPQNPPVAAGDLAGSQLLGSQDEDIHVQDCTPVLDSTPPKNTQDGLLNPSNIYIGNVKLQAEYVDTIAGAFLQSSRKTLHFVPPTRQNGEIIIRPTKEVVDNGSKKWRSTAVGIFWENDRTFLKWNHFRMAMEDVIEGGPWLFQGQPIVLQPWEQGIITSAKHTQIPVWIRLKHLPMEYWTDEGLSTVASGVGTPLYTDGITKDCSRLDFARVCVMLDFNSTLPKHLVVISPVLRNGKEDPKRIDVEYEWLPQRCKSCCSLGHGPANCPANVKKNVAPPLTIFVQKQPPKLDPKQPEQSVQSMENNRPEIQ
ncbi:UNVERIFIED_CONTAM: hypothetical protein Sangu_2741500 [Sesamum angustifolium]|uniref:DUF4283 domain-containing protein n=1 Tax=Sesamum angustifolium TaxID=2727405 RepID=A0AAW2IV63_9LAMI